jgi:ABC-2 type transport system permease protein
MARQPAPFIQTPPLPGAFARGVGGQGAKEKRGQLNRDDSDGLAHSFQFRGAGSVNYLAFMFPGIVAMSVLFTSVFSAMSFVWDFKEVLVSPVPRAAIAVGKALGGATIAVVQGAVILVLGPVVGIPLRSGTYFGMLGS